LIIPRCSIRSCPQKNHRLAVKCRFICGTRKITDNCTNFPNSLRIVYKVL